MVISLGITVQARSSIFREEVRNANRNMTAWVNAEVTWFDHIWVTVKHHITGEETTVPRVSACLRPLRVVEFGGVS